MDYPQILLRILVSLLAGALLGLDRNLRGKPSGIRTLGLVSLGACLLTMASTSLLNAGADQASLSRVIQGLVTGIGFLGAGVIVHESGNDRVRGLTTAASVWMTAILGILCGMGFWQIALIALVVVFLLFALGKPIERALHRRWINRPDAGKHETGLHDE